MDFMKKVNQLTEKVGEFAVDTYKTVAEKSNNLVKETKTKLVVNERIDEIDGIYKEIGKKVYRLFKNGENVEDFEANCKMIARLEEEKEELENSILGIKNQKRCENCNEIIDSEATFCSACGYVAEIKAKKTEKEKTTKVEVKTVKKPAKVNENKEPKMVKVPIIPSKVADAPKVKKDTVKDKEKVAAKKVIPAKAVKKPEVKVVKKVAKKTVKKEVDTKDKKTNK
ncbi:MAG: zinc ribbon domain-containing protein [Clostridia bacterium]